MPGPRRSSAEVRANKQKKQAAKEDAAIKTKAAKARVKELRKAIRVEQGESDGSEDVANSSTKVKLTKKTKKATKGSTKGFKSKGGTNSKTTKPPVDVVEPTINSDSVSVRYLCLNAKTLTNLLGGSQRTHLT